MAIGTKVPKGYRLTVKGNAIVTSMTVKLNNLTLHVMKKPFLMLAFVLVGYCSYAQSPIFTTAGYGANYSAQGAYLGWNISVAEVKRILLIILVEAILANGNVGIGATNLSDKLTVAGTSTMGGYGFISIGDAVSNYNTFTFKQDGSSGNILIGKTSQTNVGYKLDVNSNARANEIVVNTTGADFVFNDKYTLPKLAEVKSYIDQNHHLRSK